MHVNAEDPKLPAFSPPIPCFTLPPLQIYGFPTMDAAARAFDLLTCKRAMEKGRGAQAVQGDAINVSTCWCCIVLVCLCAFSLRRHVHGGY